MFDQPTMEWVEQCVYECKRQNLKIAFAESCTAGLLTYSFGRIPGVSEVLLGAVITYADAWKHQYLNVKKKVIKEQGAVSQAVGEAMANGLAANTGADLCLAITGIAGPTGGTDEKPVGTVWISVKTKSTHIQSKKYMFQGDRIDIQRQAVTEAVKSILDVLQGR